MKNLLAFIALSAWMAVSWCIYRDFWSDMHGPSMLGIVWSAAAGLLASVFAAGLLVVFVTLLATIVG